MVSNPAAPAQVLAELAVTGTPDVRRKIAYNPASPVVLLKHLRADPASAVAAAARRQIDARRLPGFERVSRWPKETRLAAASDLETDPVDLDVLAFNERTVRELVATNPTATSEMLHRLGADSKKSVRRAVAANPSAPMETLAGLTRDEDRFVRLALVERKSPLPPHLLARLAGDEHNAVRARVAAHRELAPDLLTQLASDPSAIVRRQVAAHSRLPAELFGQLQHDSDLGVRLAIVHNDTCPLQVLSALCADADPQISKDAQVRLHRRDASRTRTHPARRRPQQAVPLEERS